MTIRYYLFDMKKKDYQEIMLLISLKTMISNKI